MKRLLSTRVAPEGLEAPPGLTEDEAAAFIAAHSVSVLTEVDMSEAEIAAFEQERMAAPPTSGEVNRERDARVALGFVFGGKIYDSRPEDQKRISGAATLAFMAIVGGALPGNTLWHGGAQPFAWIAKDNTLTPMDAPTVVAFGRAAAAWESAHLFAARALKDTNPVPAGFRDDQFWPPVAAIPPL